MKRLVMIAVATVSVLFGLYAEKRFVMLDRVVAVVGGSSIMYSEVEELADQMVRQRRSEGYTSDRDPMNEALENLMMRKLLFNQAQLDSVNINKGDVMQRVERQVQSMIDEAGSIPALEQENHMAIYNIRELLRRQFEEQAYAGAMQQEVISKINVVPGEVERFYNSIDKDSLPIIPRQFVYAHITKYPKGIEAAKRRTKERLLEMRERIVTGKAKFATLARMYSVDGSAIRGGELEPSELAGFVQTFADALAELKPGQVSEVVETEFGFHIIQLIDKKGSLYHCRHILLRPVYSQEELTEQLIELDSIASLIRSDSLSFAAAAERFSDDKYSKMNGGIVSNHDLLERYMTFADAKLTATKFLEEDFGMGGGKSIDDYNAIRRMEVGEVSPAYRTSDLMGNDLCKIVQLVEIIPPHTASLDEDYLRIEQMALDAKQHREFYAWLNKKIDGMYVYIAPEFRDGEFENKNWVKESQEPLQILGAAGVVNH